MTKPPKIPADMAAALRKLEEQYRELEDGRDRTQRHIAGLEHKLGLALADPRTSGSREVTELRRVLSEWRSILSVLELNIETARQAHSRQVQAAEQARQPAKALEVGCPSCGAPIGPWRTGPVRNGHRIGTYLCAACDVAFEARWSGGIEPEVIVRML